MKKILPLSVLALALFASAQAGSVSTSVPVNATVSPSCVFEGESVPLTFNYTAAGGIDGLNSGVSQTLHCNFGTILINDAKFSFETPNPIRNTAVLSVDYDIQANDLPPAAPVASTTDRTPETTSFLRLPSRASGLYRAAITTPSSRSTSISKPSRIRSVERSALRISLGLSSEERMFRAKTAVLFCIALCLGNVSSAVKLVFNPTLLKVNTVQGTTASTLVTNQDLESVEFTAEVLRWTQKDGEEVLAPSRDILVSPQKFVVLPGRSQTVRMAVRLRDDSTDAAYRLILTALPKPPRPDPSSPAGLITNSVVANYAFRIPVFVTNGKTQSSLTFNLNQDKTTLLGITNSGNGVAILKNITVTLDGTRKVLGNTYVLPLSRKDVTVEGAASGTRQATVSYDENGESRSGEVELGRR